MWKLKNKLFGWDYIHWKNSADQGVARVHRTENGVCWYWRYKLTKVADIVHSGKQVIWLTCHPDKYLDR